MGAMTESELTNATDVTVAVLGTGAGTTGVITLDRPRALNALNLEMIRGIAAALDRFAADDGIRRILPFQQILDALFPVQKGGHSMNNVVLVGLNPR